MDTEGNIIKSIAVNIFICLISVIVFLLVAEGAARSLWPSEPLSDNLNRLEGYTIDKKPGIVRILVLGDSNTYGWGVRREDTFSKKLERLLNQGLPEKRYEVINTGLANTNTVHHLNILKNLGAAPIYPESVKDGYVGMAYKPDLIVLSYNLNDVLPSFENSSAKSHAAFFYGNLQINIGDYALPLSHDVDLYLFKHSRFYRFFLNRYDKLLNKIGLRKNLKEILASYEEGSRGWQEVKNSLMEMSVIAKKNDVKISIFIWPMLVKDMKDNYAFMSAHQKVASFSSQLGIPVFDLLDVFRNFDGTKFYVSPLDPHPNPEAHQLAAQGMYNFIINNNLLK